MDVRNFIVILLITSFVMGSEFVTGTNTMVDQQDTVYKTRYCL